MTSIRTKANVIFKNTNKFLFTVCHEHTNNQVFYIPVGGGIEVGEYSIAAAKREVLEEIDQDIENIRLLDINENIFKYNGIDEHEIVFVYQADFKNKHAYEMDLIGNLNDKGDEIKLIWATLSEIKNQQIILYPEGLTNILEKIL